MKDIYLGDVVRLSCGDDITRRTGVSFCFYCVPAAMVDNFSSNACLLRFGAVDAGCGLGKIKV